MAAILILSAERLRQNKTSLLTARNSYSQLQIQTSFWPWNWMTRQALSQFCRKEKQPQSQALASNGICRLGLQLKD